MNKSLRYEIVKHIFSCFGIISSDFVNSKSLLNKDYVLEQKLSFEDDSKYKIYGVELSLFDKKLNVLFSVLESEFYMLIDLDDSPSYGLYLSKDDSYLAATIEENWIECNAYLQGTFLSGMEQIKDIGASYSKSTNVKHFDKFINFVIFHQEGVNGD